MNLKEWVKIKDVEYARGHPANFMTHLHYVSCFNQLSKNLKLDCKIDISAKIKETKYLAKKIHLINLLIENLKEEYKLILNNPPFAEVCIPWIAVKSYYLIFNLLLVIRYLITNDENSFNSSHYNILKEFKSYLKNNNLIYNKDNFNKVYNGKSALN